MSKSDPAAVLQRSALSHPETRVGIACKGTSLERPTVEVRGKAFVFLGKDDVRLKLRESIAEAQAIAAKEPARVRVGGNGWTLVSLAGADAEIVARLEKWIAESYRAMAPKTLATAPAAGAARQPAQTKRKR